MVELVFNPSLTSFSRREVTTRSEVLNTAHRSAVEHGYEAAVTQQIAEFGGTIDSGLIDRLSAAGSGLTNSSAFLENFDLLTSSNAAYFVADFKTDRLVELADRVLDKLGLPPLTEVEKQSIYDKMREGLWKSHLDFLSDGTHNSDNPGQHCFLEDSTVQMWPLDPSIKPRPDGSYDEQLVLSKVWYKRQDQMKAGDLVVSPDKLGRLQPGRVTRTMTNTATHILDFWGTGVTPGHAYNCADGPLKGGFAPLMDILRMDGALMRSDGTMFRSTTNCDVGTMGDMMIHAAATMQKPGGSWTEPKPGKLRFGTRITLPDGRDASLMELAHEEGWKVTDEGYMIGMMKGEDGKVEERVFHFPYRYGAELPEPEDYILKRSAVTLEDIYLANEWEQIGTRMPAPDSLSGFNPNSNMKQAEPRPNIPPAFANRLDRPMILNEAFSNVAKKRGK